MRKKPKGKPRGRSFQPGNRAATAEAKAAARKARAEREAEKARATEEHVADSASPQLPDNTPDLLALIDRCLERRLPRGVEKNLRQRRHILEMAKGNVWGQERLVRWCRRSIRLLIDLFGWQYNPKKKTGHRVGPFLLWDFQEEALTGERGLLWCIEQMRPAVMQKSRELGATWLIMFLEIALGVFQEHTQIGNVSRTEAAVDCKSPDSLFWKLRFILKHLPSWLVGEYESQKKYIGFTRSGSTITGEASTGEAYSGGRASIVFVDEAAKIKDLEALRQSLASVTDCVVYNSTHLGAETAFHKLTREPAIVQITMHWTQHPEKNKGLYSVEDQGRVRFWEYVPKEGLRELPGPKDPSLTTYEFVMDGRPTGGPHPRLRNPWYDLKARDIGTARGVAEELDIDPSGSSFKPFDPVVINHLKLATRPPSWEGDLEVDAKGNVVRFVRGTAGPLKLWFPMVDNPPLAPYAAGADVSQGTGATPSCLDITNGATGEHAAMYVNANLFPDDFALVAAALCRWFYSARIAWENAGPGVTFYKTLTERANYWTIYMMGEENHTASSRIAKTRAGFHPQRGTKNVLLTRFYLALQKGEVACYDWDTLDEMLGFTYDTSGAIVHPHEAGKDPSIARENHGDRVMAKALSTKMVLEGGRLSCYRREEQPRTLPPEQNILTFEGRRALRRMAEMED